MADAFDWELIMGLDPEAQGEVLSSLLRERESMQKQRAVGQLAGLVGNKALGPFSQHMMAGAEHGLDRLARLSQMQQQLKLKQQQLQYEKFGAIPDQLLGGMHVYEKESMGGRTPRTWYFPPGGIQPGGARSGTPLGEPENIGVFPMPSPGGGGAPMPPRSAIPYQSHVPGAAVPGAPQPPPMPPQGAAPSPLLHMQELAIWRKMTPAPLQEKMTSLESALAEVSGAYSAFKGRPQAFGPWNPLASGTRGDASRYMPGDILKEVARTWQSSNMNPNDQEVRSKVFMAASNLYRALSGMAVTATEESRLAVSVPFSNDSIPTMAGKLVGLYNLAVDVRKRLRADTIAPVLPNINLEDTPYLTLPEAFKEPSRKEKSVDDIVNKYRGQRGKP